jgi:thioredoxin 1
MVFTDQNFKQEVEDSSDLVLVDFFAPWCGPCKMLGPIIEELINDNAGKKVKIGKINVDENQTFAEKYGVMGVPTMLFIKNGEIKDKIVGLRSKSEIQNIIEKNT